MPKNYRQQPDGSYLITEDTGPDAKGNPTGRSWSIPPEQLKAHVDGMAKPGEAFADMSAGDRTAALDAHRQRQERLEADIRNGLGKDK